jgi:methionine sulfoxide reductase heme-binding subunit
MLLLELLNIGKIRWLTHLGLAIFSLAACYVANLYAPYAALNYTCMLGFGYGALILVAVSLIIGPFKLLSQRRNPVNINLRRDVGIWSAITACLHILFVLPLHKNGEILAYFLEATPRGYRLIRNLFGFSNDMGLLATVLLVALLVISNDLSLRWLKGKRWKWLQRGNYLIAAFVLAHTFGFQAVSRRERPLTDAVIFLTIITLAAQAAGIYLYRSRSTRRMHQPEAAR